MLSKLLQPLRCLGTGPLTSRLHTTTTTRAVPPILYLFIKPLTRVAGEKLHVDPRALLHLVSSCCGGSECQGLLEKPPGREEDHVETDRPGSQEEVPLLRSGLCRRTALRLPESRPGVSSHWEEEVREGRRSSCNERILDL